MVGWYKGGKERWAGTQVDELASTEVGVSFPGEASQSGVSNAHESLFWAGEGVEHCAMNSQWARL